MLAFQSSKPEPLFGGGEDKLAAAATDDLEVESEPADDARLPDEEEEEVTGDLSTLIDGDLDADEER